MFMRAMVTSFVLVTSGSVATGLAQCEAITTEHILTFRNKASLEHFRTAGFPSLKTIKDFDKKLTAQKVEFVAVSDTSILLKNVSREVLDSRKDHFHYLIDQNAPVTLFKTPTDGDFHQQCGLQAIHAESAWDYAEPNKVAKKVKVAIVDSGIEKNHRDLPPWRGDDDRIGHGTHIAGTIGALQGNGGTVGVVWDVELYGYRFTDQRFDIANALKSLDEAIKESPNIVVLAWGTYCPSSELENQIRDHPEILFVTASGNDGKELDPRLWPVYPAILRYDNLITVMATACDETVPSFSSYSPAFIDIAAPGSAAVTSPSCADACGTSPHGILSTALHDRYCCLKGTSMSAAFVSGAAALVWEKLKSPERIKKCLMESAKWLSSLNGKCRTDSGQVDLRQAVDPDPVLQPDCLEKSQ
jgi:subtilisin family serine protease